MVSRGKPGGARSTELLGSAEVEALLHALVEQNRRTLFEPWRSLLAASPDLQDELGDVVGALRVFFNKWVVEIIVVLGQGGAVRFNQLKETLDGISGRTLSERLKELEQQGMVERKLYDEMPLRVEYSLTKRGTDVAALALPLVLYLLRDGGDASGPS